MRKDLLQNKKTEKENFTAFVRMLYLYKYRYVHTYAKKPISVSFLVFLPTNNVTFAIHPQFTTVPTLLNSKYKRQVILGVYHKTSYFNSVFAHVIPRNKKNRTTSSSKNSFHFVSSRCSSQSHRQRISPLYVYKSTGKNEVPTYGCLDKKLDS